MMNTATFLQSAARDEVARLLASKPFEAEPSDLARAQHLREATTHVEIPGLWLEFGVSIGTSTATLAECAAAADARLYGFDSFEGLPEEWVVSDDETWSKGAFTGRPSEVPSNVELVDGWFEDTVPGFVEFHLLKGPVYDDHTLYSSHTTWVDKAAFEAWTKSEEFRRAHARADNKTGESLYLGHPKFEGFEVIQSERKTSAAA